MCPVVASSHVAYVTTGGAVDFYGGIATYQWRTKPHTHSDLLSNADYQFVGLRGNKIHVTILWKPSCAIARCVTDGNATTLYDGFTQVVKLKAWTNLRAFRMPQNLGFNALWLPGQLYSAWLVIARDNLIPLKSRSHHHFMHSSPSMQESNVIRIKLLF